MRDKISIERVKLLHPKVAAEVAAIIDTIEKGFPTTICVRVVQGLRTFAEQDALYAQGRTKSGPVVTKAKGGQSIHNYGLALDFAIMYDLDGNGTYETVSWDLLKDRDRDGKADWMEVVTYFEANGWKWGGRWKKFKDNPHVEKTFGYTWQQLLALKRAGKIDQKGYVIIK